MSPASPQLVPLEEVGGQMGGAGVETVVARIAVSGLPPAVEDWQGRPAVPAEVAAKLASGYQREVAEAEARRAAYDAYVPEREQHRQTAGQAAAEKGMQTAYEAGSRELRESYAAFVGPSLRGSPSEQAVGRQARLEALAAFDSKHPLIAFERFKGKK
jgi:hypothetical protein